MPEYKTRVSYRTLGPNKTAGNLSCGFLYKPDDGGSNRDITFAYYGGLIQSVIFCGQFIHAILFCSLLLRLLSFDFSSVSSWHKQDNTLMHQSPGHIQRRTPYNF